MAAYRIFTVAGGDVSEGAEVRAFKLRDGAELPAIVIGDEGRGRSLGVLPVQGELVKPPKYAHYPDWAERWVMRPVALDETRPGNPRLVVSDAPAGAEAVIVAFRGGIGFRGGYAVLGERVSEDAEGRGIYADLPASVRTLASGVIAQGEAGRMGSGTQRVVLLPRGVVVAERRTGRLYGAPGVHFVLWTGERLIVRTLEERRLFDDDGVFPPLPVGEGK